MAKIGICFANGCEEIEGLTVVDLLRRADIEITMISINDTKEVIGSHKIPFTCDSVISDVNWEEYDGIVLPGGMPGTIHLGECDAVTDTVKKFAAEGKLVSAICAAPSVLGKCGVLEGKKATSYPGFADVMTGCTYLEDAVITDGNVITSRGMGTAIDFGLAIIAYVKDENAASELAANIMYSK